MVAIYATSLVLIGLSGLMLDMHRRSWRGAQENASLTERDRRFAMAQFRRRTQGSAIIGLLGAAIALEPLVPARPWPMAIYVASLAGACGCIMVLASLDMFATRQNFLRLHNEQLAAQLKLARELKRDDS